MREHGIGRVAGEIIEVLVPGRDERVEPRLPHRAPAALDIDETHRWGGLETPG